MTEPIALPIAQPVTLADILSLVRGLTTLSASLPQTVPLATQEDKIYLTVLRINEGDAFETFNRIFDILFKEDTQCLQADHLFGRGDPNSPLLWWKTHERDFPVISKMARDFLAIPGTSVSVERLFSSSRHLCSELRSSMKANTIMHSLLSKTWIKDGLFDRILLALS